MTEPAPVVRVPALKPLSPMQMTVIALLADGFDDNEAARLIGIEVSTFNTHLSAAVIRIPGDLRPARARAVVWYRGGSAAVLGVDHALPPRQEALTRAYAISVGRSCAVCGYIPPHENNAAARGRHQ